MGNSTSVRVAHQVTLVSSFSSESAPILGCRRIYGAFRRVLLDRELLVLTTGDLKYPTVKAHSHISFTVM